MTEGPEDQMSEGWESDEEVDTGAPRFLIGT